MSSSARWIRFQGGTLSTPTFTQEEIRRYSRHLLIPEVGLEGQRKLKSASVLIIGTGGLGSPISLYLAAAGIGRIGIVDYDVVDVSNLQRQIAHGTSQVGNLKVESARARMLDLNPYIQVEPYAEPITVENAEEIAKGYDILVDGTDNFPTRYLINDLAVLTGRPFVYGSIFRFEGQVSVFDARSGPCYRCLFPEAPPAGSIPTCAEGGVFGVLPGTIGTLQATEVIKLIVGIGSPLIGKLLLYDALDTSFQTVQLRKNPRCKICGEHPEIDHLIEDVDACGPWTPGLEMPCIEPEWIITTRELNERLQRGESIQLVDVREPVEQQVSALPGAINIPQFELESRLNELNPEDVIVTFCRTGVRSARAVALLRKAGFSHARHLAGGINAWARDVDTHMFQY
jgi:sulfur-carrier protein adenylyltransferase/sulfurtransferase